MAKYTVVGGAGFIGSHLVREVLTREPGARVVIYDNFTSGRMWHLEEVKNHPALEIIREDVKDVEKLARAMEGSEVVYHFASNPDIAKAMTQPDIDFWEGTFLTNNVVEAMRRSGAGKLLYASGSGIYGDTGLLEVGEDHSPLTPISTYGASKLACEALVCAYCHMFNLTASAFRFANVVGPRQTHGVGYDFIRKLTANPGELSILGDGTQSKSYIYIDDVVCAIRLLEKKAPPGFSYYNVATQDYITVTEIANLTVDIMGLTKVEYRYAGGSRGWKGDVPVVRLNSDKIRALGWANKYSSKEAIAKSLEIIRKDATLNKFGWTGGGQ
ncbi:NAD-dependent epimerase/dehydratase family protein [candidate division FCPU426 bacterium]|nr:NAD-dependent epimerase/dehydratase family protein [candidate division FCPU426 bacterium]